MATWKKPAKCQIGSLTYKIKYVEAGKSKYLDAKEAGAIDQHTTTIYIDKNAPRQLQLLTLLHEFMHGVGFVLFPNRGQNFREHLATAGSELLLQALQSSGLLQN